MEEMNGNQDQSTNFDSDREQRRSQALQQAAAKAKKTKIIVATIGCVVIVTVLVLFFVIIPSSHYNQGVNYSEKKNWDAARREFIKAGQYSDAQERAADALYQKGLVLKSEEDYDSAISIFEQLDKQDDIYEIGQILLKSKKYSEASQVFMDLNGYKDSNDQYKECFYQKANDYASQGDYDSAYAEYTKILGYKDVANIIESRVEYKMAIGTYMTLGHFEQDGNGSTSDPIEWRIIGKTDDTVVLLSKYCLGWDYIQILNAPLNEGRRITGYLKSTFSEQAFSADEKNMIQEITILTKQEVEQYLPDPKDRITTATKAAGGGDGSWWTRSPGRSSQWDATAVDSRGQFVAVDGSYIQFQVREEVKYEGHKGIRPAIFIRESVLRKYLSNQ